MWAVAPRRHSSAPTSPHPPRSSPPHPTPPQPDPSRLLHPPARPSRNLLGLRRCQGPLLQAVKLGRLVNTTRRMFRLRPCSARVGGLLVPWVGGPVVEGCWGEWGGAGKWMGGCSCCISSEPRAGRAGGARRCPASHVRNTPGVRAGEGKGPSSLPCPPRRWPPARCTRCAAG